MTASSQPNLTDRDEKVLTDLYFCRILSTEQIAAKYFNHYNTAKSRLAVVKDMDMITRRNPWQGTTIWMLTRRAFDREIEALGCEGERYRDWPKQMAIGHFLDTNDVFIDISEEMDEVLGEHPAWEWKNEPRAREAFKDAEGKGVHRPDAEIAFADNRYFLERQTSRARKTAKDLDKKLETYRRYIRRQRREGFEGEMEVLYACDEERDMKHAKNAADHHGVQMTAGKPGLIAEHLVSNARAMKLAADE